jgi:hypothetical protein
MTSPLPPEVVDVYEAERLSDPVYMEAQRPRVLDWLNVAHQHELAAGNEWSYYGKAADLITTLTRDLAAARAEAEGARRTVREVRAVMGPKVPKCCNGCQYEWSAALRLLDAANEQERTP